jgi:hypothetical protein
MWREQWRVCERGGVNRRRRRRASNPFSGINGAEKISYFAIWKKHRSEQSPFDRGDRERATRERCSVNTKAARAPCVNEPLF